MASPGAIVGSGALVTPGGAQGPQGTPGTGSGDMLKAVYDANTNNKVDAAENADAAPWAGITGKPATFAPSVHAASHVTGGGDIIVPASASTAGLLKQVSGLTSDFVDGTNTCQDLAGAVRPVIWYVRTRSFNAIDNPNFEVDQVTCGAGVAAPVAGQKFQDRWYVGRTGTAVIKPQQQPSNTGLVVPGTNFRISGNWCALTLTTQQASLAAGDHWDLIHYIEGPSARELFNDVSSFSILATTSIAGGLKFGLSIRDNPTTKSLCKLCTIPAANTWTLISLPNIPVFPAGNFSILPGDIGYEIRICVAAGTTFIPAANDVWQTGNFLGAVGQDNFASKPTNSVLYLGFVQHEPGSLCSGLIDLPFRDNLAKCKRYFYKTNRYNIVPGVADALSQVLAVGWNTSLAMNTHSFEQELAVAPLAANIKIWDGSGAANTLTGSASGTATLAVTSVQQIGTKKFNNINITTNANFVNGTPATFHYSADTGF